MLSEMDPTAPLTPSGNLRRRIAVSRLMTAAAIASAVIAVAALAIVVFAVASRGAPAISLGFLTHDPPQFGGPGGGIASAIVGTTLIVAIAAAMATPLGVLTALYLSEYARPRSRAAQMIRMALDLMQGLPSIIVGVVVFGLIVNPEHRESGFAGSVALAIIMLPLIARSGQEVLLLVPQNLREAADALGVRRWRSILGIVLPSALPGIVTGTILSIARAAGETAPLLILSGLFMPGTTFNLFGQAVPNIPMLIFNASEAADPTGFARAWGAALVLLVIILIANIGARVLLARSRARMSG